MAEEYNFGRPHMPRGWQALESVYEPSERNYLGEVGAPYFPGHYKSHRIGNDGTLKLRGIGVYLSQALGNELVGLAEIDDGRWRLTFGSLELATHNERIKEIKQIGGSAHAGTKGTRYKEKVSGMRPV